MLLRSLTPSFIGRWKALRPLISPTPPARLLITVVLIASAKSFLPEAPPECRRSGELFEGKAGIDREKRPLSRLAGAGYTL